MTITFPNETQDYRIARADLLAQEIALRDQVEKVAALRRSLPPGGEIPEDYRFTRLSGSKVAVSDLLEGRETLMIYSLMYGDGAKAPCPMCSAFLDGLATQTAHFPDSMRLAVVAAADTDRLSSLKRERGWAGFDLLSAAGTTYQRDYRAEAEGGNQLPILNVFVRNGGIIRHFWGSELFFADTPWHPRHLDLLWPLWNLLDLTPGGREDHMPRL